MASSPSTSHTSRFFMETLTEDTPSPLPSPPMMEVKGDFAVDMKPLPQRWVDLDLREADVHPPTKDIVDPRMSRFPIMSNILPFGRLSRASYASSVL